MTGLVVPWLLAEHLGRLHTHERLLVLLLAFGPFVVLGVVVHLRRKQDLGEDRERAQVRSASHSAPT